MTLEETHLPRIAGQTRSWTGVQPIIRPEGQTPPGGSSYGESLAALFNLDTVQTLSTSTLKSGQIAISRLASEAWDTGMSAPLPVENAYIVALQLRDAAGNRLLRSGEPAEGIFLAGSIVIAHLEDEPVFDLRDPFDMLLIHIPQIVFCELAEEYGAARIGGLSEVTGIADAVVHDLGRALLPFLTAGEISHRRFFDYVAFAIHAHLATRYGLTGESDAQTHSGLTLRQARTAKEVLAADLSKEPPIEDAARACGLPLARFVRAFRQTTGMPPHRWLRAFRVDHAKELLLNSTLSLGQIAYECGFADQSHFTRIFSAATATTPGAWRRARRA